MSSRQGDCPLLSIVITVHNEGDELRRTIASVRKNTRCRCEILVVDDGSTDGCCESIDRKGVRLLRHATRVGVARSRHEASGAATGATLAFLDGHQRVEPESLDECARLALERGAIVWPDVCGFETNDTRAHGALFTLSRQHPPFSADWKSLAPARRIAPISALRAPGYVIPRAVYPKVKWLSELRGWGGSEAAISLKAFFTGVDILHLCGPLIRHRFTKSFRYEVRWPEVWRNHALIARVCFDERTWYDYWLPQVFDRHLTPETQKELESSVVRARHDEFSRIKLHRDREFWTKLLFREPPAQIK